MVQCYVFLGKFLSIKLELIIYTCSGLKEKPYDGESAFHLFSLNHFAHRHQCIGVILDAPQLQQLKKQQSNIKLEDHANRMTHRARKSTKKCIPLNT